MPARLMDPVGLVLACLMGAAFLGTYAVLFCWSLCISPRGGVPWFLRITSFAALALSTAHVTTSFMCLWPFVDYLEEYGDVAASYLNLTTTDQLSWSSFTLPHAPNPSKYTTLRDVIFLLTGILHDTVFIWRLHMAWDKSYLICAPSTILATTTSLIGFFAITHPPSLASVLTVQDRLRNFTNYFN
ncbi:uncharacterized protein EI90DRAFT_2607704 [Cantharellus anzutake]|uniref:uncharacterized protein n=1 Tax=Cantharellus anzutake TaxID=1750568 RepID=UPI0019079EE8|nr:uncharacterized protein EI90DRAFT_2607704 [Cantharellus anzutake]KAF8320618.1 hypothetical protein EI90DRAFT_2607704 [Cantharellus anzutake]